VPANLLLLQLIRLKLCRLLSRLTCFADAHRRKKFQWVGKLRANVMHKGRKRRLKWVLGRTRARFQFDALIPRDFCYWAWSRMP
jgi:hypothetical protein